MKKAILLLLTSLPVLQGMAQPRTAAIRGRIMDTAVQSIELIHPADETLSEWKRSKVDVLNGSFRTSLPVPFPVEITLVNGERAYSKKFISGDTELRIDSAGNLQMTGSPVQEEYEKEFLPFFEANDRLYDSLQSFYRRNAPRDGQAIPKHIRDSATWLQERYYGQRAALLGTYIRQHPDSYVSLWEINFFVAMTSLHRYFDFGQLLSSFSGPMQQGAFIGLLREKIKDAAKLQAGGPFPQEFFKGHEALLATVAGKSRYFLVDFWYSHCAPCAREFPKLRELYRQYGPKGFEIVSISVDKRKDEGDYRAAIRKYDLSWKHVWDRDGVNAAKYSIHIFPTYILLDGSGRIVKTDLVVGELEAFLKEHF